MHVCMYMSAYTGTNSDRLQMLVPQEENKVAEGQEQRETLHCILSEF